MTTRTVLRSFTVKPADLAKNGVLLGLRSRTIAVMPGGELGTLDVIVEQDFEHEEKA